ncbi:MAG: glutamate--tRNA ligase [Oscillospiraceae bacterium]|jgi:glutamyl-tRNA synthetase|nr:glutamate--tRNA ligase [Oscillospiraceae bacterium]
MKNDVVRTRFAPSPTGFMHIGNLRTALYAFLIAKSSKNGKFILRIEDTDQNRKVEGAVDLIFKTLKKAGINYDEGPDVGGNFGPYIQSMRLEKYFPYALELIKKNKAYYCFCEQKKESSAETEVVFSNYNRRCRNLSKEQIKNLLSSKIPYCIRQKMPLSGSTTFDDVVFGTICVDNKELEDQILIKSDGYPTYNFANVIDDHEMKITHVVRGSEYLTSTPKYNLLYEFFEWEIPIYIHTGLILGKNKDGIISKLSKRHGATSFEDLESLGYLPEVIVNYIALLGWCPGNNCEIFSLKQLIDVFSIGNLNRSPSIFDYDKLNWFNFEYLKNKSDEDFIKTCISQFKKVFPENFEYFKKDKKTLSQNSEILVKILKPRLITLVQIPKILNFLKFAPEEYDISLFENKKSKSNINSSIEMLTIAIDEIENLQMNDWSLENIKNCLINLAKKLEIKNGTLMWPIRISLSAVEVTPGGAPEIITLLGKDESLKRMKNALDVLKNKV